MCLFVVMCLCFFIGLSLYVSVFLCVCLFMCLSFYVSVSLCVCLFMCLSFYVSVLLCFSGFSCDWVLLPGIGYGTVGKSLTCASLRMHEFVDVIQTK